jgi:transposase
LTKDKRIAELEKGLSDLGKQVAELLATVASQAAEISNLKAENAMLREENAILKVKKNSGNSSMNPASDLKPVPKTNSREKTDKKPGGQTGRKPGNLPKLSDSPDKVRLHLPKVCKNCGLSLAGIEGAVAARRQELEVPKINALVVEHRQMAVTCTCGCNNLGAFPDGVAPGVQFGKSFEALTAFLCTRHYISVKRVQEVYRDVLGVSMSTGAIGRLMRRTAKRCESAYAGIKAEVMRAIYIGADETGTKVNGDKGWFWVWQTQAATYIVFAMSRGFEVVEEHFPGGFPGAILGHDSLPAQFKTVAKAHQMCMAHILRELKWNIEAYQCDWSKQVHDAIKLAWKLKDSMTAGQHGKHHQWVVDAEDRLDKLLTMDIPAKNEKSLTLRKRFIKKRDSVFQFLYHPEVPPDNNGSERAIRNVKVKQKVSTQFKSQQGAMDFATIRSVIDTAIKQGKNVLDTLRDVA